MLRCRRIPAAARIVGLMNTSLPLSRRDLLAGGLALLAPGATAFAAAPSFDRRLPGWANAYKEGDEIAGLAAADEAQRGSARRQLAALRLQDIDAHPLLVDAQYRALMGSLDPSARAATASWTLGELKAFLLTKDGAAIKAISPGLSSDVIGCVVKLLDNAELTAVSAKIFNPLPGTEIGAQGVLGARIQPNSPTDDPEDIRWQVLDAWAYGVGDLLLGTNPVSSEPEQVHAVEVALQDLLVTFGLADTMPHCVLAHIDVQAEVEQRWPGSTALWFQSIAGSDAANATFDLTLDRLLKHADTRKGHYGLYFETGQGADCTNGHAQGMDMVLHESRKYGLARLLSQRVAAARGGAPWLHLNDVAGFIGPEVFRTREQLVRCCLEDLVMGKLHGLCIGLDICSTLHMDVTLDDLDWCQDAIAPAQPAYLMALPTKIDPMLGYLTTGYQDHVRLRERFGLRLDARMGAFYRDLGVLDAAGRTGPHFGDPVWVYLQYRRRKGDTRTEALIRGEARQQMAAVRARGVFLAEGHGASAAELEPSLGAEVRRIYEDGKRSIRASFDAPFRAAMAGSLMLHTQSRDRDDYLLHPASGEMLDATSEAAVAALKDSQDGRYDVQILVSDGLNALALNDARQRDAFLARLREGLLAAGRRVAPGQIVIEHGRVRTGYRIGEQLFGGTQGPRAILHVIGERPGTGHHAFSVYMTVADGGTWGQAGKVDHDITRVVAGIASTALEPRRAADEATRILGTRWGKAGLNR
ncbi:MAG: Ethanolamine ammonia-lyase heavy chain [Pseudomonadota bacterium]